MNHNILLIAMRYYPFEINSDKNFFYNLIPKIIKKINNLIILSINDFPKKISIQKIFNKKIIIYNIKRSLRLNKKYIYQNRFLWNSIEKQIDILFSIHKIKKIITKYKINWIIFIDNFGFFMRYIRYFIKNNIKIGYFGMSYNQKKIFYDQIQKFNFKKLDKIIVPTFAYFKKISTFAIPTKKIAIVKLSTYKKNNIKDKNGIRKIYMEDSKNILILWTGFIQQIKEQDFYRSIKFASKIIKKYNNLEFIFAFKQECFKKKYLLFNQKKIRIINNKYDFEKLIRIADFLFSPILNTNSIIAPPLTWIEAMSLGLPIITTKVNGVNEFIINGKNGFITNSYENLENIFKNIQISDLNKLKKNCITFSKKYSNLEQSANQFLEALK